MLCRGSLSPLQGWVHFCLDTQGGARFTRLPWTIHTALRALNIHVLKAWLASGAERISIAA
jgi:hypothetical protein